jgi:GNAT superfamily N-acetyltransferase
MTDSLTFRRAGIADVQPAYGVFRRALFDYLFRQALVDEATAKDPPIDEGWARQHAWIEHLWATAAENWVAVDRDDTVVGWAMSVERGGSVELTHFFVEPGLQARGIGRALIHRAFPEGLGTHRTIIATQDAPALGLYFRSGVRFVTTSCDFLAKPTMIEPTADLHFVQLTSDERSVSLVADIEEVVLGYRREADTRFLLGNRPAWMARRDGRIVGFAFGAQRLAPGDDDGQGRVTGPIAALDPRDQPALIDHVIREAAAAGISEIYLTSPLSNQVAVDHLLARGCRIDPFYLQILASDDRMQLDRWLHTGPVFIM